MIYMWRKIKNFFMIGILALSSIVIIIPLFFIFGFLIKNGYSALSWDFFTQLPVPIGQQGGGLRHALVGTVYMVALAGLIGIPWGMGAGVYLSEYGKRNRFATLLRMTVDLLSGAPSIVIGIVVYAVLVEPFKGYSAIAGAFALCIILLPIVIKSTEEILKLVPRDVREAGLALGMPRWRVIFHVVIKAAKDGLLTGVILAIARAAGETAPLLFTAFGNNYLSYKATEPMASLPVQIYNYAISPYPEWHKLAWGGSFVLILMVVVLNAVAKLFIGRDKIKDVLRKRRKA